MKRVLVALLLSVMAVAAFASGAVAQTQVGVQVGGPNAQTLAAQNQSQGVSSLNAVDASNGGVRIESNGAAQLPQYPYAAVPTVIPSQTYVPGSFLNSNSRLRPTEMTAGFVSDCQAGQEFDSVKYAGKKLSPTQAMQLQYLNFMPRDAVPIATNISDYVGVVTVVTNGGDWFASLCKAAQEGMKAGFESADVEFAVVPKNNAKTKGIGATIGTSGIVESTFGVGASVTAGFASMSQFSSGLLELKVRGFRRPQSAGAPPGQPEQKATLSRGTNTPPRRNLIAVR